MKATAHFEWDNGTKASFPCNWEENGNIAEAEEIAAEIYFNENDKYEKEWNGELLKAFVCSDKDENLRKNLHFDAMAGIVYASPPIQTNKKSKP